MQAARPVAFVAITDRLRARDFYQGILGLELVADEPFALVFDLGGVPLRLALVDRLRPQPFTVLGWQVDDIEETLRRLAAAGILFEHYGGLDQDEQGGWRSPSGARIAWFKDPEGNVLSVTQVC